MNVDLTPLIEKIDGLRGIVEKHIMETLIYREEQKNKLEKHEKALEGNGTPGLKTKVDRLERSEDLRNWILGVIFVAVVGMIVNEFAHFIK